MGKSQIAVWLGVLLGLNVTASAEDFRFENRLFSNSMSSASCTTDLSRAAVIILSGGAVDSLNPASVLRRMEELGEEINAHPYVRECSRGSGLLKNFLPNQRTYRNHYKDWPLICERLSELHPELLIIIGHSYGGAGAVSLSRCLEQKNIAVDLLMTADSVDAEGTLGETNVVPQNVKHNVNTYLVPNAVTWIGPFPFGKKNTRGERPLERSLLNVGLHYFVPAMVAHRNAFYDFAGGERVDGVYAKPNLLLNLTLAKLMNVPHFFEPVSFVEQLAGLSRAARIKIELQTEGFKKVISAYRSQ